MKCLAPPNSLDSHYCYRQYLFRLGFMRRMFGTTSGNPYKTCPCHPRPLRLLSSSRLTIISHKHFLPLNSPTPLRLAYVF
jgi:hypothetical protein